MKIRILAAFAFGILAACNVSDTSTAASSDNSISPRLMMASGVNLPVTDSVHIKLWSNNPSSVWYEKTLPWSAKFVVISGVPQGTNFLFSIEGRKRQFDGTQAVWWSGSETGTANQSQSLNAVDLPVWVVVGDTVAPVISGPKDTILDSAITGVRLRWTITESALASVYRGSNKLVLTGNVTTDTVSVSAGGATTVSVKAVDVAGNTTTYSMNVSRKAKGSVITTISPIPWNTSITYDSFTDPRDQQTYRTIKIGNQRWMAQNLNYSGASKDTGYCYANSSDSCTKYGRLYTWGQAMAGLTSSSTVPSGARGVCPVGWHLPSNAEWDTLTNTLGGATTAGTKLKAKTGFPDYQGVSGNGTDSYGFTAVPSNRRQPGGVFQGPMGNAYWWTSQASSASQAYRALVGYGVTDLTVSTDPIENGFSIRCINDSGKKAQTNLPAGAVGFTGRADFNHLNVCPLWAANSPHTIEFWVRPDSQNYTASFGDMQPMGETRSLMAQRDPTQTARTGRIGADGWWAFHPDLNILRVAQSDTIPTHQWSHIAWVYTGSEGIIYINGKEKSRKSDSQTMNCGSDVLVTLLANGATLDNVRISKSIRYSNTFTPPLDYTKDASTVFLWKFDGNTSSNLTDEVNGIVLVPDSTLKWVSK